MKQSTDIAVMNDGTSCWIRILANGTGETEERDRATSRDDREFRLRSGEKR